MSAFDNYIDRLKFITSIERLLTPEAKRAFLDQILELFKQELGQEVQQTIEPYIIKGDKVSKVYTVKGKNGIELPLTNLEATKNWVNALLKEAEDGSVIIIEVSEPVKKYSLWKHEASECVFMFDGDNYLCVDGGKYSSWNVGEVLLFKNAGTLVPLEGQ